MAKINIYTPTYHRFNKTKVAVESIIKTVNSSKHDVKYFICDNNSPQEMKNWICERSDANQKIEAFLCEENWGKAKIVNHVHKGARDCDYIVSIDSDMLNTHTEYNWIDEMVDVMEKVPQIGVLSSFQEGNNCHLFQGLTRRAEVNLSEKKHTFRFGAVGCVAGGCIIMRSNDFNQIGMYQVYDVYNGDDAFLMRKTNDMLRKICAVSETIALEHIVNYDDEDVYQQWKVAKANGQLPNGEGLKGFYDK